MNKLAAHCFCLALALTLAGRAWAEPTEADRATARALALEGHSALVKRDYATAADRFERADALVHAPTLVVDWARSLRGLGRLVAAHEKYELVVREGVADSAPKSWLRALDDAKKELAELEPRLAWVTVDVQGPPDAVVKINGAEVPPAALGVKRAADPGFPEITVSAPGYKTFEQTLAVGPGQEKSLQVSLEKQQQEPAQPAKASPAPSHPRPSTQRILSYVAFGVGGAGLAVGGVTGALALRKRSDLRSECKGEVCSSGSAKKISTYHMWGTLSGAALVTGVAGVGAGVVLLFTEPKRRERVGLTPLVGPGFIGAEGRF